MDPEPGKSGLEKVIFLFASVRIFFDFEIEKKTSVTFYFK